MASGWFKHGAGMFERDGCHCAVGVLLHIEDKLPIGAMGYLEAMRDDGFPVSEIYELSDRSDSYELVIKRLDVDYAFTEQELSDSRVSGQNVSS